jgi:hypothetical protein
LGASFRWWPIKDSELYVVGTLNDMNGDPNARGLDWSTFGRGEYFYGTEIGYFWRRDGGETDHLHLDVFYASKRSTRSPDTLPNVAGGGFKLLGEKQIGRFVGFGSYTYNTAEGGGISSTMTGHTAITGLSYLKPMGLQGEASIGYMWSQAFSHLLPLGADGSQHGIDTYWKILLTPNIWVTPGTQFIWHPVLNPNHNFTVVPDIKFRIFF